MRIIRQIIAAITFMAAGSVCAQVSDTACNSTLATKYEAGTVFGSGDFAPMWHFSNRQGIGSNESNWTYAKAGIAGINKFNNCGIKLN